jgi:hypothetical protein
MGLPVLFRIQYGRFVRNIGKEDTPRTRALADFERKFEWRVSDMVTWCGVVIVAEDRSVSAWNDGWQRDPSAFDQSQIMRRSGREAFCC